MIASAQRYLAPKDVTAVVYHFPCHDGRGAMAAALMSNPAIIEIKYDVNTHNILDHAEMKEKLSPTDNVLFIDCAPPGLGELKRLRERYAKVMVIDHHAGNEANLYGDEGCFFRSTRAGCMLAWEYFHTGIELPPLLNIIGERDLGNFGDPVNKYVGFSFIDKPPATPLDLIVLINQRDDGIKRLVAKGMEVAKEFDELKSNIVPRVVSSVRLAGQLYNIAVVQMENHRFVSELGEHVLSTLDDVDLVMLHYPGENGVHRLSFRTNSRLVNVAQVAKLYGGNGHREAAGAAVKELPEWAVDRTPHVKRRPAFSRD